MMAPAPGAGAQCAQVALKGLTARLSVLMFLEFFIWGSWSVTLGLVMQTLGLGEMIANAFSVGPIASIIGSFFFGMLLVRYVSPKHLLALLHLFGCGLLLLIPLLIKPGFGGIFVWVLFSYLAFYMPTVGIANNLALKALASEADRFPFVRAFGTLGWIVAGLLVGWLALSASPAIFFASAAGSLLLAAYSFTLPNVIPDKPSATGALHALLCVDGFALLKDQSFLVFMLCATLISIPLAMYYAYTSAYIGSIGFTNASGILAIGQMSELGFMFSMPMLYRRFGVKTLLLVGMMAWALRYAMFAVGDAHGRAWAIYVGIALHGVCYDFFFVAGAVYTGTIASPKGLNAQAQGLLTLCTYGIGMLLGSQVGGLLYAQLSPAATIGQWHMFWMYPAVAAGIIALLFQLTFRERGGLNRPSQVSFGPARRG